MSLLVIVVIVALVLAILAAVRRAAIWAAKTAEKDPGLLDDPEFSWLVRFGSRRRR